MLSADTSVEVFTVLYYNWYEKVRSSPPGEPERRKMIQGIELTNYHTHTPLCRHAQGTEEEYVLRAIQNGFSVLGFADHGAWPYESDYVSYMRMSVSEFWGYESRVRALEEKYRGQIRIPLGMENEAFPPYINWLKEFKEEHLDYLILGNHYDYNDEFNPDNHLPLNDRGGFYFGYCSEKEQILRYGKRTVWGMETGVFDYLAHPDLFCFLYPVFDEECAAVSRDLCAAAEAYHLPLEVNLNGMQRTDGGLGYPCRRFWEIASDYHITAIVGYDAHRPDQLGRQDLHEKALDMLKELRIPVTDRLPCENRKA